MTKQIYNDQAITRYLLGSLPEAEAERLDELSFTDDEFAGALKVAEKDLVDAYVRGELSGAALERFKSYYLASPMRRERVRFAQAFQEFAEKEAVPQAAEVQAENPAQAAAKRKVLGWFSALSVFTVPRWGLQWGFAVVAIALLIGGGWLVFENGRLRQQVSQTQARRDELSRREQELQKEIEGQRTASAATEQELAQVREERGRLEQELKQREQQRLVEQQRAARQQQPSPPSEVSIASFILTPQVRGVGQIPVVSIPAKTGYVAMRLQLEPNDYPAYRVALLNPSNHQTLWRSGNLKARAKDEGKTLSVSFRAALLKPQPYVLQVTGVSPDGVTDIISDYPFKVVR